VSVSRRRRRPARVRTRLVALVLVPVVGVAVFGGREALERARTAGHAAAIERKVDRASTVTELRLTLAGETFATAAIATGRRFGLDETGISALFGTDLAARERRDRAGVDRLVRRLHPLGSLAPVVARLHAVRAAFDRDPGDLAGLLAGMSSVQAAVTNAGTDALASAQDAAARDGSSPRLRRDLILLDRANAATIAVGVQTDALGQLIAPAAPADVQRSLTELREGLGLLATAQDGVDQLAPPVLARAWRATERATASVRTQAYAEHVAALAPSELPRPDLAAIAPLFSGAMARMDRYDDLTVTSAAVARATAAALRHTATDHMRVASALAVALIAAALALAFAIARSIGRPLTALADHAAALSTGDLSLPAPAPRGPRELVEVSATLGEVVENLRLVEAQVGALAVARVDDPILDRPVPGRLGSLLHDSVIGLSQSISDREQLARRLAFEASHDPLTGLRNRATAAQSLRESIARSRRDGRGVAVLLIDLDGLKRVNDTYGRDTGDAVVRATATRLCEQVREGDVVARIGGDEFAVLVEGLESGDDVAELAHRLVRVVAEPVVLGLAVSRVGASVGVAMDLDGDSDAESLLRDAGLAAGRAKTDGGGRAAWFDAAMYSELVHRAEVERELRAGLDHGELVLHFQPVVAPGLRPVGAEALIRWERDGGLVFPGDFIPAAEASDLIIDVGRFVLHEACRRLVRWGRDASTDDLEVAVNLSGRHLLSLTVVDDVRDALEATGADPARLVIEITETVVVDNLVLAGEHLDRLRALGVRIAIDDFGTGYTSLAHLRRLPADVIKLDRSLVVAAADEPADARVLELVVGTAHALGMTVVAEGIETDHQLELARRVGCDQLQGYLLARPGPEPALRAFVAALLGAIPTTGPGNPPLR
jgi:diguanylate cyclase (GGDEF)-like protein